ncbi:MAG: rRNA pseudouridine synthase [Dehalococcoidia bacterium]|nr:MAG: rRNA pseudouridine synthase [Dehalococcoidia bacterium]
MEKQSLLKTLTQAGIGSRRKMSVAIKEGRVSINGEVVTGFNSPVTKGKDRIVLNGKQLDIKAKSFVCLKLNKPKGILSTTKDERGRRTIIDILPRKYRHLYLYPVGRLDKNSTGLLLLTNNGDLAYRLTHPRFEKEKEYEVQIQCELNINEIHRLEAGIKLEDGKTAPATVKKLRDSDYNYAITIHEGRKHQVRRMFISIGHRVIKLKRVRIGNVKLGNLKEGQVKEVSRNLLE